MEEIIFYRTLKQKRKSVVHKQSAKSLFSLSKPKPKSSQESANVYTQRVSTESDWMEFLRDQNVGIFTYKNQNSSQESLWTDDKENVLPAFWFIGSYKHAE